MHRRDFLIGTGAALTLGACAGKAATTAATAPASPGLVPGATPDSDLRALADVALDAARAAGASYADVRIADYRNQSVRTREQRVLDIEDASDSGFGVRVIVDGAWGFAASARVEREELVRVAQQAVAMAKLSAKLRREPVQLAPTQAHVAVWNTPVRRDPFDVSVDEKVAKQLEINAAALGVAGVSFCSSRMAFVREHKLFASTEGSYIEQTLHRCNPSFTVTSVDRKRGSFKTRNAYTDPQGLGYEYIEEYPWLEDVRQAGEDVVAKHTAPSIEPGLYDLILHPTHLWLTIHESIGHPTELDRALGMEANYAGTSFLTVDKMGSFRIGSEIVNFRGEKTHPGSLATCGYDDDGVQTMEWPMVERGIFVDYQTTREQAHLIGHERSHGTAYAQSWKDVPFQRMPNINLEPGEQPLSLDALIADTERAILIKGRGSYSIDHQRYNFQFGGQAFYLVENGAITGLVEDVAYQSRTPDFWGACDAICSQDEYYVGGSFYDGKGEPGQANAVSHGCAPARFRQINVINTARTV
ncbi:TldD/PmbA family protein [Haliangium ochraceum]|uniref:Peptidase U62 modulator of DNA gyrase n=1 Tax=Haliangium ochraceum (strain DSM 14365 / JCM 11303 / SMP-2) TaxID=502025 RepID=D0LN67_HALO1|nr:TldD/PmbA family protein [Haliangium ochraceum]ACY15244.1 peptidase U62 modulator of DNA gyrase [Haliangium ochraceum DSM 14365]